MEKKEDIISTTDLGLSLFDKPISGRVFYEEGYGPDNLPKLFRVDRQLTKRWTGVRACCPESDGIRVATSRAKEIKKAVQAEYPDFVIVRYGWKSARGHHCENRTRSWPDQKRSCWAVVNFPMYVDIKRTQQVEEYIDSLKAEKGEN